MEKIKIIFAGTDEISVPLMETLFKDERYDVVLAVTQADKPAGRKMQMTASPVKIKAIDLGIEVFQPENINETENINKLRKLNPDIIVVMAYGQMVSREILDIPQFGCINIHASILPKHRGASPIQQSLLHMDKETGISVMKMEEKMDTGPIFAIEKISISDNDDALTLYKKLSELTARTAPEILSEIAMDGLEPKEQEHTKATYCQKIHKTDGNIDWTESAQTIGAKIRAFAGWPGTYTFWNGKRVKILSAKPIGTNKNSKPGTVSEDKGDIIVYCGNGALVLSEIQMEGKNIMKITDFIKGYKDFIGSALGN